MTNDSGERRRESRFFLVGTRADSKGDVTQRHSCKGDVTQRRYSMLLPLKGHLMLPLTNLMGMLCESNKGYEGC
jgi:hypothetical protein